MAGWGCSERHRRGDLPPTVCVADRPAKAKPPLPRSCSTNGQKCANATACAATCCSGTSVQDVSGQLYCGCESCATCMEHRAPHVALHVASVCVLLSLDPGAAAPPMPP